MSIRICHLGCVHASDDPRICMKECKTLFGAGYDVSFMTSYQSVKPWDLDHSDEGVRLIAGEYDRRGVLVTRDAISFIKFRKKNKKIIIDLIRKEKPDLLHVHEFELMYVVKKIKKILPGIKVIFDVHEDIPGSYYDVFAENTNDLMAGAVSCFCRAKMKQYVRMSDAVITVTPGIKKSLSRYRDDISLVCNFPIVDKTEITDKGKEKEKSVCYCGLLKKSRGISTLLNCAGRINGKVHIAGPSDETYGKELRDKYDLESGTSVLFHGSIRSSEVKEIYAKSSVGICLLKRTRNYYDSYPTKLFEYMMAGLPIVCSNFPAWREIVEDNNCGILVDPENEEEIVNAINYLIEHEEEARKMGQNGQKAVEEKYNWDNEAKRLMEIYKKLVG